MCRAFEVVRKCEDTVFDENAGNSRLELLTRMVSLEFVEINRRKQLN